MADKVEVPAEVYAGLEYAVQSRYDLIYAQRVANFLGEVGYESASNWIRQNLGKYALAAMNGLGGFKSV